MRTAVLAAALVVASGAFAGPASQTVSPQGRWLAAQLDGMGVEYQVDRRVAYRLAQRFAGRTPGTFPRPPHPLQRLLAAAAEALGVYILRPPKHGQILLANAQFQWLGEEGAAEGWRELPNGDAAQGAANAGELVVAAYESHLSDKPGHIAIVKPAARSAEELAVDGPLVIQAGSFNSGAISLRAGFSGHPSAWASKRCGTTRIPSRPCLDGPEATDARISDCIAAGRRADFARGPK